MVTWYWSADNLIWQVSIDHNLDVKYQRSPQWTKATCLCQPIIWSMAAMLRDSTVAAVVVRTRPRELPLATITWENQFMGFLYFPIWVWGSAWRSFGPPELRYKNYAKTHGDRAGSMTRSEINRVRRQDYENVISPYFRKIPKTPWKSIVVY